MLRMYFFSGQHSSKKGKMLIVYVIRGMLTLLKVKRFTTILFYTGMHFEGNICACSYILKELYREVRIQISDTSIVLWREPSMRSSTVCFRFLTVKFCENVQLRVDNTNLMVKGKVSCGYYKPL